jgi:hypothetical protein
MDAIDTNPEMEDISEPGSQDHLLLRYDKESKLKFHYFIVPRTSAYRKESWEVL